MPIIISVCSEKGGVGKTTTTINLAQQRIQVCHDDTLTGEKIMGSIDFTAIKNKRKAIEDKVEADVPSELADSYTNVWGSNKETVIYIETTRLIPFIDSSGNTQPFHLNQRKVEQIAASAKDIGIVTPLCVRAKGDLYEIIAGHHRLEAAKSIGQLTVPCIVRTYSDDEMYEVLAESNIQRDKTLPSEYGKIFNKYMSMRDNEDTTAEEIALKFDISRKTLYRYLNVGKLIPELQELADLRKISIAAVDSLVQLSEDTQLMLCIILEDTGSSVTPAIAKKLTEAEAEGSADEALIREILEKKKAAPDSEQHSISRKLTSKYFKPDTSDKEIEATIQKALEMYFSHLNGNSL